MPGLAKSRLTVVVATAAIATAVAGCGGAAPVPAAPAAPAEQAQSPAAVASGLKNIQSIAAQIAAAGTDTAKAKSLDEQIEPQWQKIEDTVKANDPGTYQSLEDAFGVLEGAAEPGGAASAGTGSQSVSAAVQKYLAAHPG